jgi:hypothetical protein
MVCSDFGGYGATFRLCSLYNPSACFRLWMQPAFFSLSLNDSVMLPVCRPVLCAIRTSFQAVIVLAIASIAVPKAKMGVIWCLNAILEHAFVVVLFIVSSRRALASDVTIHIRIHRCVCLFRDESLIGQGFPPRYALHVVRDTCPIRLAHAFVVILDIPLRTVHKSPEFIAKLYLSACESRLQPRPQAWNLRLHITAASCLLYALTAKLGHFQRRG